MNLWGISSSGLAVQKVPRTDTPNQIFTKYGPADLTNIYAASENMTFIDITSDMILLSNKSFTNVT